MQTLDYSKLEEFFNQHEIRDNVVYKGEVVTNIIPNHRALTLVYLADTIGYFDGATVVNTPVDHPFTEDDLDQLVRYGVIFDSVAYDSKEQLTVDQVLVTMKCTEPLANQLYEIVEKHDLTSSFTPNVIYIYDVVDYKHYLELRNEIYTTISPTTDLMYHNPAELKLYEDELEKNKRMSFVGNRKYVIFKEMEQPEHSTYAQERLFNILKFVEKYKDLEDVILIDTKEYLEETKVYALAYLSIKHDIDVICLSTSVNNQLDSATYFLTNSKLPLAENNLAPTLSKQYAILPTKGKLYLTKMTRVDDKSRFRGLKLEEVKSFIKESGELDISYTEHTMDVFEILSLSKKREGFRIIPLLEYFNLDPQQGTPNNINEDGHDTDLNHLVTKQIRAHFAVLEKQLFNFTKTIILKDLMLIEAEGIQYIGVYTPNYEIIGELIDLVTRARKPESTLATNEHNPLVPLNEIYNKDQALDTLANYNPAETGTFSAEIYTKAEVEVNWGNLAMGVRGKETLPYQMTIPGGDTLTFPKLMQELATINGEYKYKGERIQDRIIKYFNLETIRNNDYNTLSIYGDVNNLSVTPELVNFLSRKIGDI